MKSTIPTHLPPDKMQEAKGLKKKILRLEGMDTTISFITASIAIAVVIVNDFIDNPYLLLGILYINFFFLWLWKMNLQSWYGKVCKLFLPDYAD